MRSSPEGPLVARLERIRDLSEDLSRELGRAVRRAQGHTAIARALADTIKQDIDVVSRALKVRIP